MSLINTKIIPFKATAYHNGKFVPVSDENFKGKWSVVVFYPADFTFVCPTELGDLADHYAVFKDLGVEVYGVSTDTHFTHKAWHDTSDTIAKVKYPLVGDPSQQLARAFQVLIEEGEDAGLALRGTFLIDPEGKIKTIEVHDNGIGRDAAELLRRVKAAQYVAAHPGEVCPAKWTEGAETLKPSFDLVGKIQLAPRLRALRVASPKESLPEAATLRPVQACAGRLGAAGPQPCRGRAGRFGRPCAAALWNWLLPPKPEGCCSRAFLFLELKVSLSCSTPPPKPN